MKTFRLIFLGIVVLVLLVAAYFLFGNYSEGTRGGIIVKMSRRGVAFKTVEGQLNLGGLSGETGSPASSLWNFTVSDSEEEVIKAMENAELNGQRIKLFYKEKFYRLPWRGDTKYFIYKVETADGKVID